MKAIAILVGIILLFPGVASAHGFTKENRAVLKQAAEMRSHGAVVLICQFPHSKKIYICGGGG